MYGVRRVDPRQADDVEPLGTKRKFWFREGDRRVLFKAEDRGTGEDWAEKIACELCGMLGLPHVRYELAVEMESGAPGVVCDSCVAGAASLLLGNQLLVELDPAYPAAGGRSYRVREHTVEAVAGAVGRLAPPPDVWMGGVPAGVCTAIDVFTGYVMLDAWIANQDRHHENWAALREDDAMRLAPTFDHGASLARNISDEERKERLETNDRNRSVSHFARRATSAFFADTHSKRPLRTVDAFVAFARFAPDASRAWTERLRPVSIDAVEGILAEIPPHRMSRIAKNFTLRLLTENQQRLIEVTLP